MGEAMSAVVPLIRPKEVRLSAYPEGGWVVEGVPNRVYIEARRPNGEPADVTAKILRVSNDGEKLLMTFNTTHEGRGRSGYFVPRKCNPGVSLCPEQYVVRTVGAEVPLQFDTSSVSLTTLQDVYEWSHNQAAIRVRVASPESATVRIVLSKAHRVLTQSPRTRLMPADPMEFSLLLHSHNGQYPSGVLRATVYKYTGNDTGRGVAERLLFLIPPSRMQVSI